MHQLFSLALGFTGLWFISFIPDILRQAPPSLHNIALDGVHENDLKLYDWKAIDSALASQHLPELRTVDVHLTSTYYDPEVLQDLVRGRLPIADKRGLLRTTCTFIEAEVFSMIASVEP